MFYFHIIFSWLNELNKLLFQFICSFLFINKSGLLECVVFKIS
ncbi:hypothetical protein PROSTU_04574 [Providencia stuartii ATCC 25827]|uniref:Uncharacterized protein n=1 Tax=Providencia stuartii ATCC 25827 TaxID=471874 RepID=A0AA87CNX7_PROST|nr:hypothetical protein PROSTU_04574 [Providencia stuartii ATCC 25827]